MSEKTEPMTLGTATNIGLVLHDIDCALRELSNLYQSLQQDEPWVQSQWPAMREDLLRNLGDTIARIVQHREPVDRAIKAVVEPAIAGYISRGMSKGVKPDNRELPTK